MTPCPHLLNAGTLVCTRTTPHDPLSDGGHVYQSSTGSDLDDSKGGGHG